MQHQAIVMISRSRSKDAKSQTMTSDKRRGPAPDVLLYRDRLRGRVDQGHDLAGERLVARRERDRDPVGAGDARVHTPLAHRAPVDADVRDGAPGARVGQQAGLALHRVIADEEDRVEVAADALHHAERLRVVADEANARRELLDLHVAHAAVRVVHEDLGGPPSF